MIPDLPTDPRQALEASLTALLLGELPPDQAEFLQRTVAQDPELTKQLERLKQTIALVRETGLGENNEPATAAPEEPRLSEERRQQLLQRFKTVAPREFSKRPWCQRNWLVPTAVAACVVALSGVMFLSVLSRPKSLGGRLWSGVELAQNERYAVDREQLGRFAVEQAGKAKVLHGTKQQATSPSAVPSGAPAQTTTIVLPSGGVLTPSDSDAASQAANPNFNTFYRLPTEGVSTGLPSVAAADSGGGGIGGGALPTRQGESSLDGRRLADRAKPEPGLSNSGDLSSAPQAIDPNTGLPVAGVAGTSDSSAAAPALAAETPPSDAAFMRRYGGVSIGGTAHFQSPTTKREVQQTPEQAKPPVLGDLPALGSMFSDNLKDSKQPGNVGVANGNVQQFSRSRLQEALRNSGDPGAGAGFPLALDVTNQYGGGGYGGYGGISPLAAANPEQLGMERLAEDALRKGDSLAGQTTALEPSSSDASPALTRRYGIMLRSEGQPQMAGRAQTEKQEVNQPAPEQAKALTSGDVLSFGLSADNSKDGKRLLVPEQQPVNGSGSAGVPPASGLPSAVETTSASTLDYYNYGKLPSNPSQSDQLGAYTRRLGELESELKETANHVLQNQTESRDLNRAKKAQLEAKLDKNDSSVSVASNNRDDLISIAPTPAAAKGPNEETLPAGVINFASTDLSQALQTYAELSGRTVLAPKNLPPVPITLKPQTPLTKKEAIQALDAVLATNGISVVDVGDKFLKVVPASQAGQTGAPFNKDADLAQPKPASPAPIPQPEVLVRENAFSTFSLNVSDVSFKLAAASLEKGVLPEAGSIRSEEFINAFDYRDPEPAAGVPVAFAWERARYPFAQNRDMLRFSIKTAATGRQAGRPLNIVLLLDNSGSMERADRVAIIHEALRVLATQLQAQDTLSVVTFARTARLWVDGVPGSQAGQVAEQISSLTPQGGTNLEEAMNLAYQTALRHYLPNGINRVVLLTDGAANLGDVDPDALKKKAEVNRKQGIALDCFGIGWEGYNDDLLEVLARNSDGRYGFINTPEEAATEFAGQLAGALQVAASDVKVQVEFNPNRVTAYRQIGYAKHQLTKEQFRDNTVNAAQLGAAESGNALYVIDCNSGGQGSIATVRVRYRVPGTSDYREQQWDVPYTGTPIPLEQASPALRLATTAAAFAEWLASSPYAAEATPDALLGYLRGIPEIYGADQRPTKLEWMLRQAKSISAK